MVRRRDSSLGGTTRSPPASPSLPVILSNSCRFCDVRRNNAPGWLKLLGIADADSTSMSRRVHSSLEQFFDKARKSGSHLTCMGLFLSSGCFWVFLPVLCSELERPFFVPSPAIRFAERAEGVKGPKR